MKYSFELKIYLNDPNKEKPSLTIDAQGVSRNELLSWKAIRRDINATLTKQINLIKEKEASDS